MLVEWIAKKVKQMYNNNHKVRRLRGRPKNRWWNCVPTSINKCEIKNWEEKSKRELSRRSALGRPKFMLD
jgi:hypothetical protein